MSNLISIIIPAYNCEKYIKRCVSSIENQTFMDFEIIIVNDGSIDNTIQVCNELKKIYSNIRVITQKNSGVSSARNFGIKNSNGKYLMFVDSDDTLPADTLKIFTEILKKDDYDIVFGNYVTIKKNKKFINKSVKCRNDSIEVFDYITINYLWAPWGKLIKKSFINMYFDEKVNIGEDALFWFENNKNCKYTYNEKVCYYYYENSNSAMHKKVVSEKELTCFMAFEKIINNSNDITKKIYMTQYINNYFKYLVCSKDIQNIKKKNKEKILTNVKLYYQELRKTNYLSLIEKIKFFIKIRLTFIYKFFCMINISKLL